jgi:hypothetical protein
MQTPDNACAGFVREEEGTADITRFWSAHSPTTDSNAVPVPDEGYTRVNNTRTCTCTCTSTLALVRYGISVDVSFVDVERGPVLILVGDWNLSTRLDQREEDRDV